MLIREMILKDIPAILPMYIYNEQEDGCWNKNTAGKRIRQVLSMEDFYGLIVEKREQYTRFCNGILQTVRRYYRIYA